MMTFNAELVHSESRGKFAAVARCDDVYIESGWCDSENAAIEELRYVVSDEHEVEWADGEVDAA
jgi:hypothetical protein